MRIVNVMKAAIISIIVAFLFVALILGVASVVLKDKYKTATYIIEGITEFKDSSEEVKPVLEDGVIVSYPVYGSKYGSVKIETAGIDIPLYYGADYALLKYGAVHDEQSYFPGEGGSIIISAHNFDGFFANLPDAKLGDIIELETSYGTFKYKIYDTQIIGEDRVDLVPIQKDEEILMAYTCWPIHNIGHASQRYVVYAKLDK